jgi:hypothetical protein
MASLDRSIASRRGRTCLVLVRLVEGAGLLLAPDRVIAPGGQPPSTVLRFAVRVLGVRQVLEAMLLSRTVSGPPPRWSMSIDAAHASSMLALAAARPSVRRDALVSAASATGLAVLTWRAR